MEPISPQLQQVLSEFGLTPAETRVYLCSLALGPRPATTLAQKAGLKRGTTYNVLTSLMQKGIAQEFVRGNVKQFVCSPPAQLLSSVDERANGLLSLKEKLRQFLPELEQIVSPHVSSPKVRFFHGIEGIKEALDELLAGDGERIYGVADLKDNWTTVAGQTYPWVQRFISRRSEMGIWYYGIVNHWDPDDRFVRDRTAECRELRVAENLQFPSEVMIRGSQIVMISAVRERMGIVVDSEEIAKTLTSMHIALWQLLEPRHEAPTAAKSRRKGRLRVCR